MPRVLSDVSSARGAPMGRRDYVGGAPVGPVTVRLIPLDEGGYDEGGAYWGLGDPLWNACDEGGELDAFFRASSLPAAKRHVRVEFSDLDSPVAFTDEADQTGLSVRDALPDLRLEFDRGDPWGSTMALFFAVAEEIEFNRESISPPGSWEYSPGAADEPERDGPFAATVALLSDSALLRLGDFCERYSERLKARGYSY